MFIGFCDFIRPYKPSPVSKMKMKCFLDRIDRTWIYWTLKFLFFNTRTASGWESLSEHKSQLIGANKLRLSAIKKVCWNCLLHSKEDAWFYLLLLQSFKTKRFTSFFDSDILYGMVSAVLAIAIAKHDSFVVTSYLVHSRLLGCEPFVNVDQNGWFRISSTWTAENCEASNKKDER